MIGVGAMIGQLGGNSETVAAYHKAVGQKIESVTLDSERDALRILLADGTALVATDEGQSCCEHRYMRTDDDLGWFASSTLLGLAIKDGGTETGEYEECHEVQFLEVTTSAGQFTMANHNEHNGYYGGFHIVLRLEPARD